MHITRIDLNSWIFEVAGKTILVDPWLVDPLVFYGQPWLFTAHHNTPLAFTPETLPPIDLIVLSQGLEDHCHPPTLEKLDHTLPVIASPSAAKVVRSLGYRNVTALAPWQEILLDDLQITAVPGAEIQPGQVENGIWLRDRTTDTSLYYEPHLSPMAALQKMGPVDVVIAPVIGQIFPLLGQIIMGPQQAMELVNALQPSYFLPTTLGDIRASGLLPLLIKTIGSVEEFRDRLIASGIATEFLNPAPGERVEVLPIKQPV
jgi:L-ascorbate metabolism protein UlaG (beta-lactamase superfamily)